MSMFGSYLWLLLLTTVTIHVCATKLTLEGPSEKTLIEDRDEEFVCEYYRYSLKRDTVRLQWYLVDPKTLLEPLHHSIPGVRQPVTARALKFAVNIRRDFAFMDVVCRAEDDKNRIIGEARFRIHEVKHTLPIQSINLVNRDLILGEKLNLECDVKAPMAIKVGFKGQRSFRFYTISKQIGNGVTRYSYKTFYPVKMTINNMRIVCMTIMRSLNSRKGNVFSKITTLRVHFLIFKKRSWRDVSVQSGAAVPLRFEVRANPKPTGVQFKILNIADGAIVSMESVTSVIELSEGNYAVEMTYLPNASGQYSVAFHGAKFMRKAPRFNVTLKQPQILWPVNQMKMKCKLGVQCTLTLVVKAWITLEKDNLGVLWFPHDDATNGTNLNISSPNIRKAQNFTFTIEMTFFPRDAGQYRVVYHHLEERIISPRVLINVIRNSQPQILWPVNQMKMKCKLGVPCTLTFAVKAWITLEKDNFGVLWFPHDNATNGTNLKITSPNIRKAQNFTFTIEMTFFPRDTGQCRVVYHHLEEQIISPRVLINVIHYQTVWIDWILPVSGLSALILISFSAFVLYITTRIWKYF